MKKLICILLAAGMVFALAACGAAAPEGAPAAEWTRQGTYEDGNGNHLIVNFSDTPGYEGWAVSLMLDGEAAGWIIGQEGNTLRGNLNAWDETAEPYNVVISEEGEDGLKLEVEGGGTYRFTPMDIPAATITVTVNIDGWGQIAYAEGEETPEIDPDFPAQSAYLGLAEPAVHTFLAEPDPGNVFVKWTKNGEDFSTEPQITLLLDESADYIAVFEEDPLAAGSSVPGIWETASVITDENGVTGPAYTVQFTDSEILYGHMTDGTFVLDHADPIASLESNAGGGWTVRAEAANGVRYTYQSSDTDENVLEYYETWQEEDFPEMYRGGASLSRCDLP